MRVSKPRKPGKLLPVTRYVDIYLFRCGETCYYIEMNVRFFKKFGVNITSFSIALSCVLLCLSTLFFVSCASRMSDEDAAAVARLESMKATSPEGADILLFANTIVKKHVGVKELVSIKKFCESAIDASERLDQAASNQKKSGGEVAGENAHAASEITVTGENTTAGEIATDGEIAHAASEIAQTGENSAAGESATTGEDTGKVQGARLISLYFELSKLAAMLHDGHTGVGIPQEMLQFMEFYPYSTDLVGGKFIVSAVGSDYENCVGKEIVELNGKTPDKVFSALKEIISYDTEAFALDQANKRMNMRDALEFAGLGSDDGNVRMKFSDGAEIIFAPLSYEAVNSISYNTLVMSLERTLTARSFYECYDILEDTLFVQYNTCTNADGYSVADFSRDVIGFIDDIGFSRVIVDLRFNGGGNSMLLDSFIKQLGKRISAGKCKGFVLIGTDTFSSAVLNAWDLKKAGCVLVGTPTGGAINHYGELGYVTLSNSGINAMYSTKHFVLDPSAAPGSIQPDVFVDFTIEDYKNGHDVQVAACLEM